MFGYCCVFFRACQLAIYKPISLHIDVLVYIQYVRQSRCNRVLYTRYGPVWYFGIYNAMNLGGIGKI